MELSLRAMVKENMDCPFSKELAMLSINKME